MREKYRARIVTELRAAVGGTATTAYEKAMQARANDLLGLVNTADDALRQVAYQGVDSHCHGHGLGHPWTCDDRQT